MATPEMIEECHCEASKEHWEVEEIERMEKQAAKQKVAREHEEKAAKEHEKAHMEATRKPRKRRKPRNGQRWLRKPWRQKRQRGLRARVLQRQVGVQGR
jgi:hypothetical protein